MIKYDLELLNLSLEQDCHYDPGETNVPPGEGSCPPEGVNLEQETHKVPDTPNFKYTNTTATQLSVRPPARLPLNTHEGALFQFGKSKPQKLSRKFNNKSRPSDLPCGR